jgi:quercetin dioxygenase-like cupin family protein
MKKTSEADSPLFDLDAQGASTDHGGGSSWLVSGSHTGSKSGAVDVAWLYPGGLRDMHRHPSAEQLIIVLEGTGFALTPAGEKEVRAGDYLFASKLAWHGFANEGEEPLRLLGVLGGVGELSDAGQEQASDVGVSPGVVAPLLGNLAELAPKNHDDPNRGVSGVMSRVIASESTIGSQHLAVWTSRFDPGGYCNLHRHTNADTFIYVIEGECLLIDDRQEVPLAAGELGYVERGGWHGIKNPFDSPSIAISGFLGVAAARDAGYEDYRL